MPDWFKRHSWKKNSPLLLVVDTDIDDIEMQIYYHMSPDISGVLSSDLKSSNITKANTLLEMSNYIALIYILHLTLL